MTMIDDARRALTLAAGMALAISASARGQSAAPARPWLRPLTADDIAHWRTIESPALSNDGRWLAYSLEQSDGEGEVVIRATQGDGERRVPGAGKDLRFSDDSRWLAYVAASHAPDRMREPGPAVAAKVDVVLIDLVGGARASFPGARRFAFGTAGAGWLAAFAPDTGAHAVAGRGTLTVRSLATGRDSLWSAVRDVAVDSAGRWLAWTSDSTGPGGAELRVWDLRSGAIRVLDDGAGGYRQLAWSSNGDRLSVLRKTGERYVLLAFDDVASTRAPVVRYDPSDDPSFPQGMRVSPSAPIRWTEDRGALLFGIAPAPVHVDSADADAPRPRVAVWHWRDVRLPPQQVAEHARDTTFSYQALLRVAGRRFLRLATDSMREVLLPARVGRWALGADRRRYERAGNMTGSDTADVYAIDLTTGARRLVLPHFLFSQAGFPRRYYWLSPDGARFLFWRDGNFHVYDVASGATRNLTSGLPTSFADAGDDHGRTLPPIDPTGYGPDYDLMRFGWARDGRSVLLSDGWDVWRIPVDGGRARRLTPDGKGRGIRWVTRLPVAARLEPPAWAMWSPSAGVDLGRPLYFAPYDERTKARGLARIDPRSGRVTMLAWGDARYGGRYIAAIVLAARDADVFAFAKETFAESPDYYVTDHTFANPRRATDANPQQRSIAWTPGRRVLEYRGPDGDTLHASLFLPAGYVPGRRYPTIVHIYERRSGRANDYDAPAFFPVNRSWYTSNGYAVLEPDIAYRFDDPFVSATQCTLAALAAAIATGVVDSARVGLTGHSFGGFETDFIITQTDAFAAAVGSAGASDMFAEYNSIYWNTGRPGSSISDYDQLRLRGPYWGERFDAFLRNSAVFHAPNVQTPLLMIANDRDEAADWHQGLEFFNALRSLGKPVILLQYIGERHAEFANRANLRDYGVRIKAFFDHYLMGQPAAAWITDGEPLRTFVRYP